MIANTTERGTAMQRASARISRGDPMIKEQMEEEL